MKFTILHMTLQLALMLFFSVVSSFATAAQCSFGIPTSPQMILLPMRGSQTSTAFIIGCNQPLPYSITFSALNGRGSQGNSSLNYLNHQIATQLIIRGGSGNLWNVPMQQIGGKNDRYVVIAQIVGHIDATMPAGQYKDEVFITVDY
jgi:spore coat protein U-like protein